MWGDVVIRLIAACWVGVQFTDAFHRWSADRVSWTLMTRLSVGDSIPEM
jgi:hypothetical protein